MEKKNKNYYLGLDIGTDSVGWAVTDENYKIIRHQGKSLWGVRLFSVADTAANRRLVRSARRRIERRKNRIVLLQSLFAPVINPIDESFFVRLDESNLYQEDKSTKTRFNLFADNKFTDVNFHRNYPTIYHLRKALLTAANPDPRLVYLALHHIIKYRGHFLIEGESFNQIEDVDEPLSVINQWLVENDLPTLNVSNISEIRNALTLPKLSERKDALISAFATSDKQVKALVELIAGTAVYANKILNINENDESSKESDGNKVKIDFNSDWDSQEGDLQNKFADDYILIQNAKLLFDYGSLKRLLGNERFISAGMVAKYEKHKSDLKTLKAVIKKYLPDRYDLMFGEPKNKKCNYTAYCGKTNFGKRDAEPIILDVDSRSQEDFYKYVKSELSSSEEALMDARVQAILTDIASGSFMPKQVSKSNAILPYQCNLIELQAILDNIEKYPEYAFLREIDEDGISVRAKIESLLKFHMPYYVGPINNHSGKYWVVRKQDGKIYPWNVAKKIDFEETEQIFTERMTNDCPYIPGAKVLPKNSLYYEEASLLNLINKIKLNGDLIPINVKQELSNFFATPQPNGNVISKLSKAGLKKWLVSCGYISAAESKSIEIDGIDDEIAANRRTYAQMCKILGDKAAVERYREELETIILWSTVAGPEKSNLRSRIKRFNHQNNDFLTEVQINRLVGLTLKGWGKYSLELLIGNYGIDMETGETMQVSVIDMLRKTNCNLSELLKNPDYGFLTTLESFKDNDSGKINYATVNALYCSPAVKKQIWQSLQIVEEIKKVMKREPLKVFVEMARGDDPKAEALREGNRNLMRKQKLSAALAQLAKQRKDLFNADIAAKLNDSSPKDLQQNKLFLYFMQNGLDAYTGKPIDYNNLTAYDRDHIYPQSKIKDDSIHDNMVLTHHEQNVRKSDTFPLPREVQEKMLPYWQVWLQCGLITKEKFNRLTRTSPLTEDECTEFINRQLVETRQSTKEVCNLLKRVFPDTEIVYSKAGLVSDFRKGVRYAKDRSESFVKVRDLNDIHHAKDAYLNIVVGNVYNTLFGHNAKVYFDKYSLDHFALSKLFMTETKAWTPGENGTIAQVKKTIDSNSILFTRESKVIKGALFNATIYPKAKDLVPLKNATQGKYALMSDTAKYGGYNSESRVYYMLVEHTQKKRQIYTFVGVVARLANNLKDDNARIEYCRQLGYVDPIILLAKVKIDSMFDFGGALLTLSGMTGNRNIWKLAMQQGFSQFDERYLKKVYNVIRKYKESKNTYILDEEDGIDEAVNIEKYDLLVDILSKPRYQIIKPLVSYTDKIKSLRDKFIGLSAIEQCLILSEIISELKCDARSSNLTILGDGSRVGIINVSNTYTDLDDIYMINRSITGIFEQRISLAELAKTKK